jgi:hypothetical protein
MAVKKEKIDLSEIYHFLSDDLRALNKLWDSGESEMGRRLFVIFVFSALEYIGWLLVNSVNKAIPSHGKGLITERQIAAAKGKESQRVDPVEHVVFALKYAAAFHGTRDFRPPKVPLWEYVDRAKKARDRVVHPKTLESLRITKEEHTDSKCVIAWLWNSLLFLEVFEHTPGTSFAEARKHFHEGRIPSDSAELEPSLRI